MIVYILCLQKIVKITAFFSPLSDQSFNYRLQKLLKESLKSVQFFPLKDMINKSYGKKSALIPLNDIKANNHILIFSPLY